MIPSNFDYVAPTTVDDAVAALAEGGEDAKVIAGGQSLMPVLRLRLAARPCSWTSARSTSSAVCARTTKAF